MKQAFKNIIKFIVFMSIVFFLLVKLGQIFTPKWSNGEEQGQMYTVKGYYLMPEDSIDVLFLGDSNFYKCFSPMQIYEKTGITSYNYSVVSSRMYMLYYMLENALNYQNPKVVFLTVNTLFYQERVSESAQRKSFDYMKFDKTKVDMINDPIFNNSFEDKVSYYFPIFRYHNRWNDLKIKDITSVLKSKYSISKGYSLSDFVVPNDSKNPYDYMEDNHKEVESKEFMRKYLIKAIELCKEKNVDLVLIAPPDMDAWNYRKSLKTKSIAEKYNVGFLELNDSNIIKLDWKTDAEDGRAHLNTLGAIKVTDYIIDYLLKNYKLEDHRKDRKFDYWNKDLEAFNLKKNKSIRIINDKINNNKFDTLESILK